MTHRGPFQPLPFCDSVISSFSLRQSQFSPLIIQPHSQALSLYIAIYDNAKVNISFKRFSELVKNYTDFQLPFVLRAFSRRRFGLCKR